MTARARRSEQDDGDPGPPCACVHSRRCMNDVHDCGDDIRAQRLRQRRRCSKYDNVDNATTQDHQDGGAYGDHDDWTISLSRSLT